MDDLSHNIFRLLHSCTGIVHLMVSGLVFTSYLMSPAAMNIGSLLSRLVMLSTEN